MARYGYDLAIVGGGSAGLTAARVGRSFGKRVALIDKARLGGDCLYYGCVPSKSLISAARVMHEVQTAARWGLHVSRSDTDQGAINGRVQAAIQTVAEIDSAENLRGMGIDVLLAGDKGTSFLNTHTLRVDGGRVTAKYVLICTGSRPAGADIPGLEEAGYLTNEDLFDLSDLPKRLAVIGGGPIGVEMAQAFRRLGSAVTILQRGPHLLPRDDRDLVDILERTFAAEGIDIRLNTKVASVRVESGEKVLTLTDASHEEIRVDDILLAVGRSPNVEGLGLEKADVTYTSRGITVNDKLQTNIPHIYAAGDVIGGEQFTHYAGYQSAQAARTIFLPIKLKFSPGVLPWVTFTDPEIAHAGVTERDARRLGTKHHVVRFPYSMLERAVTDQDPVGLMKFIIDARRRIIGCHIAGHAAGEMINEITLAMNNGLTVDRIIGSIHAYPTYSVGIPIALYDFVLNRRPTFVAKVGRLLSRLT